MEKKLLRPQPILTAGTIKVAYEATAAGRSAMRGAAPVELRTP